MFEEPFFQYTRQFVELSENEQRKVREALHYLEAPAKTELVSYGEKTDRLFFLLKGCIRKYYVKEGEKITIYLAMDHHFIAAFDSLLSDDPSSVTIECVEDSEILELKKTDLERLYAEVPKMNELVRRLLEQALIQSQYTLRSFILDSPEERYTKLLAENPELLQKLPQHMLATYLGITPTSLSRIRKRLLERQA